jgi:hypothetical protein
MGTIDPSTLDPGQLAAMLAAWAEGYHPGEAAVGLLARGAGGFWLRRRDFLAACIEAVDDGWSCGAVLPLAAVDWEAVETFLADGVVASSGELSVLRVAASLAGAQVGSLREVTASLDVDNLGHVLDAIAHRAGWHERGACRTVTGRQTTTTRGVGRGER